MLRAPEGPAAQPAAVPERRRVPGLLAEGHPRHRAEVADPLARDRRRRSDRPRRQRPPHRRPRGGPVLARQPGQLRDPRLDRAPARPVAADLRLHRHRPGREDDLGGDPRPGPALPDRAGASRRARLSQDDRQARHPDLDPDRPEVHASRRPASGSSASRRPSARPSRSSSRWEWAKGARKGRARLDYTQNASIKTLVAPYAVRPAAGAPVSAPIAWDELDDTDLRPDRWTIRTIVDRVAERGDLFAAAQTDAQELPEV